MMGRAQCPDAAAQLASEPPRVSAWKLTPVPAAFAAALAPLVGEPVAAVFLAYAPGGLAEMSLIALSLQMSVVYVTIHHVARIVLSVLVARMGGRWIG